MSINIISLRKLLERFADHEVRAVSIPTELAKGGSLLLTSWASDPQSIEEMIQGIDEVQLGTNEEDQTICELDYVFEVYGMDFFGSIPLYAEDYVRYPTPEGEWIKGRTIDEGISQLVEVWNERAESYVQVDNYDTGGAD